MRVGVERLGMEILLSQPAPPPQCDSLPRRSPAVDTGSDKQGAVCGAISFKAYSTLIYTLVRVSSNNTIITVSGSSSYLDHDVFLLLNLPLYLLNSYATAL